MANGRSSKKLSLNLRCFIDTLIHKSIYGTIYRVVHTCDVHIFDLFIHKRA